MLVVCAVYLYNCVFIYLTVYIYILLLIFGYVRFSLRLSECGYVCFCMCVYVCACVCV